MRSQVLTADAGGRATVSAGVAVQITPEGGAFAASYPVVLRPDADSSRESIVHNDRPHYVGEFKTAVLSGMRPGSSWLVTVLQKEEGLGGASLDQGKLLGSGLFSPGTPGGGGGPAAASGILDVRQWPNLFLGVAVTGHAESEAVALRFYADAAGACLLDTETLTFSAVGNGFVLLSPGCTELASAAKVIRARRFPFAKVAVSTGQVGFPLPSVSWWLYGMR
jgi:hypothetical protein